MNNIVIVNQSGSKYLFSVPENVTLKEGDKVKCDTRKGVTDGICFTDSAVINTSALPLIAKLTGATLPLKSVVGKVVTSVEPFEVQSDTRPCATPPITQQNEPKQEVVKLYCVKDHYSVLLGVHALIKGKVYEFDGCHVNYENMECADFKDLEDWKHGDPDYAACLFPLVSRPAKVGEYILIVDEGYHGPALTVGDTHRVEIVRENGNVVTNKGNVFFAPDELDEFLVLDGYSPEPEKVEPTYYSGKVVCVKSPQAEGYATAGRVYEFKNGSMTWDNGCTSSRYTSLEQINGEIPNRKSLGGKFIEYKGEQS